MSASRFWVFLALLLALGAAAAQVQNPAKVLEAGSGLVAVRVVTNTSVPAAMMSYASKWTTLSVRGADEREHSLQPLPDEGRRRSQIFSGSLPEGQYRIVSLRSGGIVIPLPESSLQFEVRAAHLSNLGTIIYQPTGNRGYTVLQYPAREDIQRALQRELPELSALALSNPVLGWQGASGAADGNVVGPNFVVVSNSAAVGVVGTITFGVIGSIVERTNATDPVLAWQQVQDPGARLVLAKESTYALNALQRLPGGEIVAGTNLGQVLVRDTDGVWARLDTGDPREIVAVHAWDRQHFIAGGEEGLLLSTEDGGGTWKHLQAPIPGALIMHVTESNGRVLLLSLYRKEMWVHSTTDPGGGEWRELKRAPMTYPEVMMWPNQQSMAVLSGDKYFVSIPDQSVHVLDLANETWEAFAAPGKLRELSASMEGFVYGVGSTFRVHPYITKDAGVTWARYDNACTGIYSGIMSLSFVSPGEAYVLCQHVGMWANTTSIARTRDGGKTWDDVLKETPVRSQQMFAASDLILYMDITGRIYSSKDGGKTWSTERRNYQ